MIFNEIKYNIWFFYTIPLRPLHTMCGLMGDQHRIHGFLNGGEVLNGGQDKYGVKGVLNGEQDQYGVQGVKTGREELNDA